MNTQPIQPPTPPQPPVPPFVPSTPEVKQSPKLLYFLLILIFLAAASFFAYKYLKLKQQLVQPSPIPSAATIPTTDLTADWKTYQNNQYDFEVKYHSESNPNELIGDNEVGQFSYLFQVNFGTNPLASQYGYELKINNKKPLDDYRTELVGHITDTIDSEEETVINNNTWKKINYKIFVITDYVSYTTAIINYAGYDFVISSATPDIDLILSTFKFIDNIEPKPSPSTPIVKISTISTSNWISVANNGVQFKIPPQAKCNDDQTCTQVSWTSQYQGQTAENNIRIEVEDYQGGSRREQFYHQKSDCHDIYQEASFGSVKALQIAIDIGWCNGGGGAILAVVNNKLVIVHNLSYNFETKEIARWDIRDTLISTLN